MKKLNYHLVKLYIATKLAECDAVLAEAKEKMSKQNFVDLAMVQPMRFFPEEVIESIEKAVMSKYGIKKHRYLFRNPTIGQHFAEITGQYTVDDVMTFFLQDVGYSSRAYLEKVQIGSQAITRPALIWMVGNLEDATGKELSMPNSDAPLAYLGDTITLKDIAEWFAGHSEVIYQRRKQFGLA